MKTGICFDTETTDLLSPRTASIIHQPFMTEIYLCKYDLETLKPVDEFTTLFNIPIPVPEHIVRITNITDEMLIGKPVFSEVARKIFEFCEDSDVVLGQNIMFDLEIIHHSCVRYGVEQFEPKYKEKICTVEMSYPMNNKRTKLGDLYHMATGKKIDGAHRAKADVLATLEVYKWLVSEGF